VTPSSETASPLTSLRELGINHNGDVNHAKRLIQVAVAAGTSAVKFSEANGGHRLHAGGVGEPRESPFGETNGDLKRGLEFGLAQYTEIDRFCKDVQIPWLASCWMSRLSILLRSLIRFAIK